MILTEEELKEFETTEDELAEYAVGITLADISIDAGEVNKLVASHRLLLSANAELSFKNQKLKKALEVAKYYLERDAHIPAEKIIDEALEELK